MASTTSYFINAILRFSIHYSWNLINFTMQFSMPKQFTDQMLFMGRQTGLKCLDNVIIDIGDITLKSNHWPKPT